MRATTIGPDVLAVLSDCRVEDYAVFLPGQLDRALYLKVNDVLAALGGKWDRRAKAHVFQDEPATRLDHAILTGTIERPRDFGFFPSPPRVVNRLIDHAGICAGHRVLEPSAGRGAIAEDLARYAGTTLTCVELLEDNVAELRRRGFAAHCADFLTWTPPHAFDRVVMNPPFGKQADIDHVGPGGAVDGHDAVRRRPANRRIGPATCRQLCLTHDRRNAQSKGRPFFLTLDTEPVSTRTEPPTVRKVAPCRSETEMARTKPAVKRYEDVPIARIKRDGGTQTRAGMNQAKVKEYADLMRDGVELDEPVVFVEGAGVDAYYWLSDGFHRVAAAELVGYRKLRCETKTGGRREAIEYGVKANARHGLPRTNEDKREGVRKFLSIPENRTLTAREVARRCDVSHTLVNEIRGAQAGTGPTPQGGNVSTPEAAPRARVDAPETAPTAAPAAPPADLPKISKIVYKPEPGTAAPQEDYERAVEAEVELEAPAEDAGFTAEPEERDDDEAVSPTPALEALWKGLDEARDAAAQKKPAAPAPPPTSKPAAPEPAAAPSPAPRARPAPPPPSAAAPAATEVPRLVLDDDRNVVPKSLVGTVETLVAFRNAVSPHLEAARKAWKAQAPALKKLGVQFAVAAEEFELALTKCIDVAWHTRLALVCTACDGAGCASCGGKGFLLPAEVKARAKGAA